MLVNYLHISLPLSSNSPQLSGILAVNTILGEVSPCFLYFTPRFKFSLLLYLTISDEPHMCQFAQTVSNNPLSHTKYVSYIMLPLEPRLSNSDALVYALTKAMSFPPLFQA